ncbi:MAG TPA: adenylate/guanylate cyclase domain-containing protein [Roseiarcus sp.]|nr:adenylate/guanylate cyclase domain-containing protein [Roseiarcus sp.]
MSETRKLAAILVADVVGYSRLTGADEEGTLARLRTLRSDLINPTIAVHNGRVVKRTGDGAIVEFRSVVEAVRCAVEVRSGLAERNVGVPADKRIEARVGIHLGDVVEKADGDLMGDGVNVAARLESICEPGGICLSEDAYRQVRDKLIEAFVDLGDQNLKNIARPVRAYALAPTGGGRPAIPSVKVAPSTPDWRLRRPAILAAVIAILENVARLIGAYAQRAATGGRPAVQPAGDAPGAVPRSRDRRLRRALIARDRRLRRALIAAAVITIVAVRAWRGQEPSAPPPPPAPAPATVTDNKLAHAPRLSIVVLPFANLSGDPKQDVLADSLTDDLTADLSHLPKSFVIGRGGAAALGGKPVDLKELGRDLGVRYALEGSVRRTGETITLNAQLILTETGADVWADRLEGEQSRLGELQAEIVSRLAKSLDAP